MEENKYIIEIKDLRVEFKTETGVVKALNGLDLQLERGKTLGLVGETGAGKTTAGLAMLRLIPDPPGKVTSGEIYFNGENLFDKTENEMEKIRGEQISMIFQDPMTALNPVFTVEDQIAESISLHEDIAKHDAVEKARDMLELVGIPRERGKEYPHQFSGGMKQRVVIAIALACSPSVLIADEPTTALDVTIQAQIMEMIVNLNKEYGMGIILITHDLGVVAQHCKRAMVMYLGQIVEEGDVETMFKHPMHPYPKGLIKSVPTTKTDKDKPLYTINGVVPKLSEAGDGCRFCDRCEHATERCFHECPALKAAGEEGHNVRCFLYE